MVHRSSGLIAPILLAITPSTTASHSTSTDATYTTSLGITASKTTAKTISVTGTTLSQIAQEAEPCAYLCYAAACIDSGCSAGDFECVCDNPNSLVVKMGICAGKYCDGSDSIDAGDWVADMCVAYDDSPASAEIASASVIIVSEISAASSTATTNPIPSGTISVDSGIVTTASSSSSVASESSAGILIFSPILPFTLGFMGGAIAFVAIVI